MTEKMEVENEKVEVIEDAPPVPSLRASQIKFLLSTDSSVRKDENALKQELMQIINEKSMGPFYKSVCEDLKWPVDKTLLDSLQAKNKEDLKGFETLFEEAQKTEGESEVREALMKKANYLCQIGDKDKAITAFRVAYEKTVGVGSRLDVVFTEIRTGLFHADRELTRRSIEKAKSLVEEGGDWDRRNKLKVYEAVFLMSIRNFKDSSKLFEDTLSTFTCTDLMTYQDSIQYTTICAVLADERVVLKEKVMEAPEVLEVIHDYPDIKTLMGSLYKCQYKDFFSALAQVEMRLKGDCYLHEHYRFYVREMRIKAYSQLLESYKSVTLQSVADLFGVSVRFIDNDLSRFVAAGRLNCVIDKVGGIVISNRMDSKNNQYHATIKQGDILLNRIQKLSRVISI